MKTLSPFLTYGFNDCHAVMAAVPIPDALEKSTFSGILVIPFGQATVYSPRVPILYGQSRRPNTLSPTCRPGIPNCSAVLFGGNAAMVPAKSNPGVAGFDKIRRPIK